jgi:hypothetical protein
MGILKHLLALATVVSVAGAQAMAAELVMFRRAGCSWCATWDREIGDIYPKTDVGRRLTLRTVDLGAGGRSDVALKRPIRYTPTFVVVERGKEVARIEGYPGQDFFWGLLETAAGQLLAGNE